MTDPHYQSTCFSQWFLITDIPSYNNGEIILAMRKKKREELENLIYLINYNNLPRKVRFAYTLLLISADNFRILEEQGHNHAVSDQILVCTQ